MYTLLIVDGEEAGQKKMVPAISWEDYGVTLVGTARNGMEGLAMAEKIRPDIVLTGMEMPILDGIGMIRKIREQNPEVEFIVLSGHGEYGFTSRAMAEGIRYYLLKPCSEEKLVSALKKLLAEIKEKRSRLKKEREYSSLVESMVFHAREQMFARLLLDEKPDWKEHAPFLQAFGGKKREVVLVDFYAKDDFAYMERFVIENMLSELLTGTKGPHVLAAAMFQGEILFLLDGELKKEQVEGAVERIRMEFRQAGWRNFLVVMSQTRQLQRLNILYEQIKKLVRIVLVEKHQVLLSFDDLYSGGKEIMRIVSLKDIRGAASYGELLFEMYFFFQKMKREDFTLERKVQTVEWLLEMLYGLSLDIEVPGDGGQEREQWLFTFTVEQAAKEQGFMGEKTRENLLLQNILQAVYAHLQERSLTMLFLANEVLYMNADYLSRFFVRSMKQKFSSWLRTQRMELAMGLLAYDPELSVSDLASITGYAPDGQYFARTFKQYTGMTPSEYRTRCQQ